MLCHVCNPDSTKRNNPARGLCCHSKDKDLQLWSGLVCVKITNTLLKDGICGHGGNS